jgi:hypothetical protein
MIDEVVPTEERATLLAKLALKWKTNAPTTSTTVVIESEASIGGDDSDIDDTLTQDDTDAEAAQDAEVVS